MDTDTRGSLKIPPTENPAVSRRNHLLVIGIDEYKHLKPLNNAVRDAQEVARVLTTDYACDIPDFAPPLYNKDATRSQLIKTFDTLTYKFAEKEYQDNLIIYFAGHGEWKEIMGVGYWALHEAEGKDLSTYFSNAELVSYIKPIKSHHTLIITDSCFSGSLLNETEMRSSRRLENTRSRYVLASGLSDEPSSDGQSGEHSPFAQAMLDFLKEKRGNAIQLWHLKDHIQKYFDQNRVSQTPIFAPLGIPDHKNGEFSIYPRLNLLHELNRRIEAGNPEDLERFIEDNTAELRTHKKLHFAHENLETLFWNRLENKPDGETCLAFLSRYLHSKNGRPEKALKALETWIEKQSEEKSEQTEDLALWQSRLRKAESERDTFARENAQLLEKLKKAESEAEEAGITLDIQTQKWAAEKEIFEQKIAAFPAKEKSLEESKNLLLKAVKTAESERDTFARENAQLLEKLKKAESEAQKAGTQNKLSLQTLTEKIAALEKKLKEAESAPKPAVPSIEVKGGKIILPEMIPIKGGTFIMGSNLGASNEKPLHKVTVSDFVLGKTAVTVAEFSCFITVTLYLTDADKMGKSYIWNGSSHVEKNGVNWRYDESGNIRPESKYNHPVIHVSWNDAKAYCDWLSEQTGQKWRLPTEAEWEYAAGGGTGPRTIYAGTDEEKSLGEYVWYNANSNNQTHPVGQKKPNRLGLYDMSGNVWEWCSDWYGDYPSSDISNPTGPEKGTNRVNRGGGWDSVAESCRVSFRSSGAPDNRSHDLGFRPVRTP
ncbi:MAG: SUMF1/EgtB/PvdO family nonheme iron enzyme [Bacteroidia bacterium]|nr:SUMF1/EgtB/PvdO family nonheme iron enzyme [Bacteroidia bacterium]